MVVERSVWHRLATAALVAVMSCGCQSGIPVTPSASPTAIAPAVPATVPAPSGSSSPVAVLPTLTPATPPPVAEPRVWFSPFPVMPVLGPVYAGSTDYERLFDADAPWPKAAEATQVFAFRWEWLEPGTAKVVDTEIQREVADLNARGIAIGFDYEPFIDEGCSGGESFSLGVPGALRIIDRIAAAGGTVRFIAFDEPLAGGYLADGPRACHWTVDRTAQELAKFVDGVHAVYPSILMGDIEPWPYASTPLLRTWLDAYRAAVGSDLAFLHLDVDWRVFTGDEWAAQAHEVADDVHAHQARFGIIYNGCDSGCDGQTDARWLARAQRNVLDYELAGFGSPDDVVFQSWEDKPDRTLPESDPNAFTHLILDYLRTRTTMTASATRTADRVAVTGRAASVDGGDVGPAPITLSAMRREGTYHLYELDGVVPAGQRSALVQVLVNRDGVGLGPVDVSLYALGYSQSGGTNRLTNPWFVGDPGNREGTAVVATHASDEGSGSMLTVRATKSQTLMSNSAAFEVTPGRSYRFWVAARASEATTTLRFFLIWLGTSGIETSRVSIAPRPVAVTLASGMLATDGTYALPVPNLGSGHYHLVIEYAGDAGHWPARARLDLAVP